ncbi:hypothetical protein RB195_018509 [Necator americanus]|uniref:Cytochrome c oxidase assembly factor 3 n=1 Tax=Necator americanus TaxID=51031 RepID=A0ABR1CBR1_NECAM
MFRTAVRVTSDVQERIDAINLAQRIANSNGYIVSAGNYTDLKHLLNFWLASHSPVTPISFLAGPQTREQRRTAFAAANSASNISDNVFSCRGASTTPSTTKTMSGVQKLKDSDMLETTYIEDLPRAQRRFAKQFEKVNEERVKEIFAKNYKNHVALGLLTALVVGIYYYTIHAVKQETFLEEIDEEMAAECPKTHGGDFAHNECEECIKAFARFSRPSRFFPHFGYCEYGIGKGTTPGGKPFRDKSGILF